MAAARTWIILNRKTYLNVDKITKQSNLNLVLNKLFKNLKKICSFTCLQSFSINNFSKFLNAGLLLHIWTKYQLSSNETQKTFRKICVYSIHVTPGLKRESLCHWECSIIDNYEHVGTSIYFMGGTTHCEYTFSCMYVPEHTYICTWLYMHIPECTLYVYLSVLCFPLPSLTMQDPCKMYKNFPSQAIMFPFIHTKQQLWMVVV